ncbi:hypothetical protein ACFOWZ_26200 [Lentzea rhizosphaerae]|uniref:LigA protein n=1 Tax=Lentzea rhizosphaerae TaxID=2041025 RepID=A0ABV8BZ98_9PSEU
MNDVVDDLLHRAGDEWRAAQPPPPEIDVSRLRGRTRWVPALAAAAVVLVAGGLVYATGSSPPSEVEPASKLEKLVVRDGTTVRAGGSVVEQGDGTVKLCWDGVTGPDPTQCPYFVPVVGVDFAKLPMGHVHEGKRVALALLTGVWKAGTLTVTETAPAEDPNNPGKEDRAWNVLPRPAPCSPPATGWQPSKERPTDLYAYLDAHADEFGLPWRAKGGVTVVEVHRGDLDGVRRELGNLVKGDLCVVEAATGKPTLAEHKRSLARLEPLVQDPANAVLYFRHQDNEPAAYVTMLVMTPERLEKFRWIGESITLETWLKPVP